MNFTDILGSLVQSGLSQSGKKRITNVLGERNNQAESPADLIGTVGKMLGGAKNSQAGGFSNVITDVLASASTGLGSSNKIATGGLKDLAGVILGGRKRASKGSIGSGVLTMLASLAFSALSKSGSTPAKIPLGLVEAETQEQKQQLENDAELVVRSMINAAKADGNIDDAEVENIVGKLEEGGLTREEKDFFISETRRPMDLDTIIASAENRPDLAAQIYTASLLAIEVDTPAEKAYMEQLANGLNIPPQVVAHLEKTIGLY